jgi:hypothetical protein
MNRKTAEKTLTRLAEQVFAFPVEEYLSSEKFYIFTKDHHLADIWAGQLDLSKESRPDLYGRDVVKNAFVLFLGHIFHTRPGDFPGLFAGLLMDFSQGISDALPLDELKKDLRCLGYSDHEIGDSFSGLRGISADSE